MTSWPWLYDVIRCWRCLTLTGWPDCCINSCSQKNYKSSQRAPVAHSPGSALSARLWSAAGSVRPEVRPSARPRAAPSACRLSARSPGGGGGGGYVMLPRRPDITGSLATSGAFQNKSTETKLWALLRCGAFTCGLPVCASCLHTCHLLSVSL